jgi:regulator of sigma E protease
MATDILYSVVSMIVVLGVMIVVHEFGHFAAAKLFKVRVETFSVGFGKRLIGFRYGETDYRISLLPLGGYVKMTGENPMESRSEDPAEFMNHPRWQRFIIAIAGPAMNIILAIGLLTGVYMVRYQHAVYLDQPAVVGYVVPKSAAELSGIKAGDRIVRVEDVQNPLWEDVELKVALSPKHPLDLAIMRDGQVIQKTVTPGVIGVEQIGDIGVVPDQPNIVTDITPNGPAAKAGLKVGDNVIAVDGHPIRATSQLSDYLQTQGSKEIALTVVRDGQQQIVHATPVPMEIRGETKFRIGYASNPTRTDKLPFGQAFQRSIEQNKKYSLLIVELAQKMVARKVSVRQMEGPIGIARASGQAAQQEGWTPLLGLMAAISLNLGIFNLFPIPILDGGLILLLLIESIMRRDISQKIKERIYQAAFVCLVLFAGMVIYNDVVKAVAQHMQ